jgi:hypothetical protein
MGISLVRLNRINEQWRSEKYLGAPYLFHEKMTLTGGL